MLYRILHKLLRLYFRLAYNHQVRGIEHVLDCKKGCIIAANHTSFLDPPLVGISIPYPIHFLAKDALFHSRFFNWLITSLNAIPLTKRVDHQAFKRLCSQNQGGLTVVIFPEGTRTLDGNIEPFSPGVALLAKSLDLPVVPAYIHGTFAIWPPNRWLPRFFGKTAISFGAPIDLHDFKAEKKHEQYRLFTDSIEKEVRTLKNSNAN